MTAEELWKVEARYQRAFARSETARAARNAAVQRALDAGWTHARIAEATGLTRGRVGQIAIAAVPAKRGELTMPRLGEERPQRWPCEECGGTGSVRCHQAEDYGVSFECEECESCHGTGVDVEALRAENERLRRRGFCDEAHILMVQALDVKALGKGRREIPPKKMAQLDPARTRHANCDHANGYCAA